MESEKNVALPFDFYRFVLLPSSCMQFNYFDTKSLRFIQIIHYFKIIQSSENQLFCLPEKFDYLYKWHENWLSDSKVIQETEWSNKLFKKESV